MHPLGSQETVGGFALQWEEFPQRAGIVCTLLAQRLVGIVALVPQRVVCTFAFRDEDRRRWVGVTFAFAWLEQLVGFVACRIEHGIGILACEVENCIRIVARQFHHG